MAPETLENTQTYNNKTDVWTFGITVWEMYSKGTGITFIAERAFYVARASV